MTNIIVKIETASNEVTLLIKDNAENLIELCNEIYAPKLEDMKQDEYRDWLFENHNEVAKYLFDEVGAKGKMKMSQTSKNVSGGIKTIATRNDDFRAWCASDFGSGTTSLAKVTASINGYEKSLAPKPEKTAPESGGSDDASGDDASGDDTPTIIEQSKPTLEEIAKKIIDDFGNDAAIELSTLLYDMACVSASDEAIEKVS